jgi:hypothetical protein
MECSKFEQWRHQTPTILGRVTKGELPLEELALQLGSVMDIESKLPWRSKVNSNWFLELK